MPRIFDNIDTGLLPASRENLHISDNGYFCVGYLNLRGRRAIDDHVQEWLGSPISPSDPFSSPKIQFSASMAIDLSDAVSKSSQ